MGGVGHRCKLRQGTTPPRLHTPCICSQCSCGCCLVGPQVPVIANGDVYTADDIDKMLHHTLPVSSCMLARGALKNTSVFSRQATPCVVPTSLASCCVGDHGCCAGFPLTMWWRSTFDEASIATCTGRWSSTRCSRCTGTTTCWGVRGDFLCKGKTSAWLLQ